MGLRPDPLVKGEAVGSQRSVQGRKGFDDGRVTTARKAFSR
jgi:hypothetical protein